MRGLTTLRRYEKRNAYRRRTPANTATVRGGCPPSCARPRALQFPSALSIKECVLRNSNLIEEVRRFAAASTTFDTARGVLRSLPPSGAANNHAAATLRSCVDARIDHTSGVR